MILKYPYTESDYENAITYAFKYDNSVIIEEYIEGKEYRFLVVGDETVAILHRVPANVTGNGVHTIEQLANIKNQDPLRGKATLHRWKKSSWEKSRKISCVLKV